MSNVFGLTPTRRLRGVVAAAAVALAATLLPAMSATAEAAPTLPNELDLARYQPVDPTPYRSLSYADNGASYFVAGRWLCRVGPQYRYVGCQGKPGTAPPRTKGAAIAGDQQGPYWVPPQQTYRFAPRTPFRAPVLAVGKRVTIAGTTCTVPRPDMVACRTGARAMILTPAWHKFYFPNRQIAHSANPPDRYLPERLRDGNTLPALPAPPK